jgi:hypothetical protein
MNNLLAHQQNKRKRTSSGRLAQQKIRAHSAIFLPNRSTSTNQSSSSITYTGTLDGKISTCPIKHNQFWTIKWSSNTTSTNETIPPNQLRKIIPNTPGNKKLLLDAVINTSIIPSSSNNPKRPANPIPTNTSTIHPNTDTHNRDPTSTSTSTASTSNHNTTSSPIINHTINTPLASTPQRNSIHNSFTSICANISSTCQSSPNNTDETSILQSFWEFESDPDGWANRNRNNSTATSLTSFLDAADDTQDNIQEVDDHISSSSEEEDNVPVGSTSENDFIRQEHTDEFLDHEAYDAQVDEIQEGLELEVNLPTLPFKFEEWDEDLHKLDDPPNFAPLHTTFHPSLDKTLAFSSIKACFEHITGLDLQFFRHLTKVMNEFAASRLDTDGKFADTRWTRFQVHEIYICLGIVLRGGITNCAGGGYVSWFVGSHALITVSKGRKYKSYQRQGYNNWALDYTSLRRFRQFLKAFRIENDPDGTHKQTDKAYQLRKMCVIISATAARVFIPGRDLSFDEGGIGCRSRRCPIRMYNKDKPDKYRIDFFILCCSVTYIIFHLEPYQGKNATNAGVTTLARAFPTTAKAVLNAVEKTGLKNSPTGCRVIIMDNRYSSPLLFVTLLRHYGIAAIGTVRKNRKGLGKELLTMLKSAERGACKVYYCKTSKILCVQWNDNKVVTVLSTAWLKGRVDIQRRVGPNICTFSTEKCILHYQQKMLGVDKSDQRRMQAGGFRNSLRPNKWFKAGIFGLFDFAATNASIAWNMRAMEMSGSMNELNQSDFLHCLTSEFLSLKKEDFSEHSQNIDRVAATEGDLHEKPFLHITTTTVRQNTPSKVHQIMSGIISMRVKESNGRDCIHTACHVDNGKRNYCKVCWLETDFRRMWNLKGKKGDGGCRSKNFLMYCDMCRVYAHTKESSLDYMIFQIEEFRGLTCFQILHHPKLEGLMDCCHGTKWSTTMNKKHAIFTILYDMHVKKYGDPPVTLKQFAKKRYEMRKRSDARRKKADEEGQNVARRLEEESVEESSGNEVEVDEDEATEDDEDHDYYEPDGVAQV